MAQRRNNRGNNNNRGGNQQNNNQQQGGNQNPQGGVVVQQARRMFGDFVQAIPPETARFLLMRALDEIETRPGYQQAARDVRAWAEQHVSAQFLNDVIIPGLVIGANISPVLPREFRPVIGNVLDDVLNKFLLDSYRSFEDGGQQVRVEQRRAKPFLDALNDLYPQQRVQLDELIAQIEASQEAMAAWARVRERMLYPRDLETLLVWADRSSGGQIVTLDPSLFTQYVNRWLDRVVPPPPPAQAAPQTAIGKWLKKLGGFGQTIEKFIDDLNPPPPPPGGPPALPGGAQSPPIRKTFRRY